MDKDRFRQGLGDVIEAYEEVAKRLGGCRCKRCVPRKRLIPRDFFKKVCVLKERWYDARHWRCRSGRTGRIRNPLYWQQYLGFKSYLRH